MIIDEPLSDDGDSFFARIDMKNDGIGKSTAKKVL